MRLTSSALRAIDTQIVSNWGQAYERAQPFHESLCTTVRSTGHSNTYTWATKRSRMREWLGERIVQNLARHGYALPNRHFEVTIGVDKDDIEDDNLGGSLVEAADIGEESRLHPDDLMVDLLENGQSRECFDGQNFYDTDHPVDPNDAAKGTYSNRETSCPLNQENLIAVVQKMRKYVGMDGRRLNVVPMVLQVPADLEFQGKTLLEQDTLILALSGTDAAAPTNVTKGLLKLMVTPQLTDANDWYVHATGRVIKPFVKQVRQDPQLVARINLNDDNVFWAREYVWGADWRGDMGYTLPFLSHKAHG